MGQEHYPAGNHAENGSAPPAGSRRERILTAAIAAFARGGFEGTSTREIAEAAGVTDPLLFYHFKSKADLYLSAVQDQHDKLRAGLDRALARTPDIRTRLGAFVEVYLDYFLEREPGLTVTLRELNGLPPDTAVAISATHHRAVTARLEATLTDGVHAGAFRPLDVPACALAIIGILQIYIRSAARSPGRFTRAQAIEQVLSYYAAGLAPVREARTAPRAGD